MSWTFITACAWAPPSTCSAEAWASARPRCRAGQWSNPSEHTKARAEPGLFDVGMTEIGPFPNKVVPPRIKDMRRRNEVLVTLKAEYIRPSSTAPPITFVIRRLSTRTNPRWARHEGFSRGGRQAPAPRTRPLSSPRTPSSQRSRRTSCRDRCSRPSAPGRTPPACPAPSCARSRE